MKLIIAIVKPEKLTDVKQALVNAKVGKMTVSKVNDDFVKPTVEAIIKGARTGKIGDGKIFVVPLEECIQVRTGETGPRAVG